MRFRVLKKLVIKSDRENVRFVNRVGFEKRVRIELTVILVWLLGIHGLGLRFSDIQR